MADDEGSLLLSPVPFVPPALPAPVILSGATRFSLSRRISAGAGRSLRISLVFAFPLSLPLYRCRPAGCLGSKKRHF
jgi:hypothetical protein